MNLSLVKPEKKIPTVFERIARKDKSAIEECVSIYGELIWALAKKYTLSTEAAELATQAIFNQAFRYADSFPKSLSGEKKLIVLIARRNLPNWPET